MRRWEDAHVAPRCADAGFWFWIGASGACLVSLKAFTPPRPPTSICILIYLQSPLCHHSAFAQYIQITGNRITTLNLLQSYFFFLIASAQAFTTLSFMVSLGESQTSLKFSKLSMKKDALWVEERKTHSAIQWSNQVITEAWVITINLDIKLFLISAVFKSICK